MNIRKLLSFILIIVFIFAGCSSSVIKPADPDKIPTEVINKNNRLMDVYDKKHNLITRIETTAY